MPFRHLCSRRTGARNAGAGVSGQLAQRPGPAGRTGPAGGSPDPLYGIAETYLAYWFAVLRDDADLIEGGQGGAVQQRPDGRWQRHLAWVFEAEARAHGQRMVAGDELSPDTVVGRWWRDETAEIDALAASGRCWWGSAAGRQRS